MRSNRHHLSTTKRGGAIISYLPKPLLRFGYGSLLILAAFGNLVADDQSSSATAANGGPLPDNPAVPVPANSQTPDNSQNPDNSQSPDNSQTPANPQIPNTPLLPQQGPNPYLLPYSSSSNNQSPQLTAPSLYTTGANNVSQIATNASLTQAFSQQGASGFYSEAGGSYSYPPIERVRLGPLDLRSSLSMNVVSDDNLMANSGQQGAGKISDTSFSVTPAVLLEYGEHEGQKGYASLIYAPTITRFFHESDQDDDNQNVALNVTYPFQRLSLNFSETYTQVSGINQDLNSRTTQSSSMTSFGGNYDIDDKLSFSSSLQEVVSSFSGAGGQNGGQAQGQGDNVTSLNSSLTYKLSEKIALSSSFNAGLDKPQNSSEQTFEQALLGVNYQPTEKIGLFAQGGLQFTQYDQDNQTGQGGQSGDTTDPIFSVGVGYTPFDSTSLSLNASQSLHSSNAESQQTVVSTGVGFSATQRFLQRFYFNFSFNYTHNDNQFGSGGTASTSGVSSVAGSQDNLVYRPSFSFAPTAWTSVAIYYQYLDNESNTPGASYHDNQMGISVSAQF
jgi:hypothetical protein